MDYSKESRLKDIVKNYSETSGYTEYQLFYEPISRHFCSVAKRITIKGQKNGQTCEEHIFVKTFTESKVRNERLKLVDKFKREIYVYDYILKEFNRLQKHLPDDEKLTFISCLSSGSDFLILENLTQKLYIDMNHKKYLDLKHVEIMVKDLAKFHALSFALKKEDQAKFDDIANKIDDLFVSSDGAKRMYERYWNFAVSAIKGENITKRFLENGRQHLETAITSKPKIENGVIAHGDYTLRNVLFKYNEIHEPRDMVMIDFQLTHYASPVKDVLFLLASSASNEIRSTYYKHFLDTYYGSLTNFLSKLKYNVMDCYSRDEFESDLKYYFPYAFANSLTVVRVFCCPNKSDEEINKIYDNPNRTGTIIDYNSEEAELEYSEMINGLIQHYIDLKII